MSVFQAMKRPVLLLKRRLDGDLKAPPEKYRLLPLIYTPLSQLAKLALDPGSTNSGPEQCWTDIRGIHLQNYHKAIKTYA